MSDLKLIAMDEEDLEVISSHVQDALLYVRDIDFVVGSKQLNLAINRCHNEADIGANRAQRSHAGLVFSHVESMQVQNINRAQPEQILSLLNVEFNPAEAPEGMVELIFADNATIKLKVNCLEVHLADMGETWTSNVKPTHKL
ncbi:MAG: DUF2948 family protein [OCS116 cluster bacterium]|nr:DUF2948 family protein [OCS116 cluster bacterium]